MALAVLAGQHQDDHWVEQSSARNADELLAELGWLRGRTPVKAITSRRLRSILTDSNLTVASPLR